ncbi:MAG: AMP-binding protein [Actinomycetota bacterium]|nr:AMP-binding protein [Actinomycetota bacterium]
MSLLTKFLSESFSDKNKNRSYDICDKYRTFRWEYNKIYIFSRKLASFLVQSGINKGDKIIFKSPNCPQWVVAFIACLKMGFVIVPIDCKASFDYEKSIIANIKPKFIFYSKENETFDEIKCLIKNSEHEKASKSNFDKSSKTINFGKASGAEIEKNFLCRQPELKPKTGYVEFDGEEIRIMFFEDLERIVQHHDFGNDYYEKYQVDCSDLAEIVFTSGSTSKPKGVLLSHRNISSNLSAAKPVIKKWQKVFNLIINPRLLSLVPLSHMYGQAIGIFIPLMIKSSVIFLNSINPEEILKAIKKEKICILGALPKLISLIKNRIVRKYGLDSDSFKMKYKRLRNIRWWIRFPLFLPLKIKIGWRLIAIISGGAAIDFETEDFFRCLAYSIFQGYGLTETAPMITLTDPSKNKKGSVGSFLSGQEIKIIDGEIYIRGENVSTGYFDLKKQTVKEFGDSWFKTGDIAEVDSDGDVFIKGRTDDLIIRPDGLNIYPYDIENVLKSVSGIIKDCAVFDIKQSDIYKNGNNAAIQKIHAVLLIDFENHPNVSETELNELIGKANGKLNAYQKIDSFSIWHEVDFPRTFTLKPKKTEIKRVILEKLKKENKFVLGRKQDIGYEEFEESQESQLYDIVNSFHRITRQDISNKENVNLRDDLGFDSLDIIELESAIEEKFDMEPGIANITKDMNLRDIENLVKNQPEKAYKIPFFSFPYSIFFVILRTIFQTVYFPFFSILYRRKYSQREFLKNLKEPTIFISNHVSLIDTFVILYSLPMKIRVKLTTVMSIEHHFLNYFKGSGNFLRRFFEALGFYIFICFILNVVPLSRTHGFKQSFENIGALIDKGWNVLIFPEGSITVNGNIKPFESGIGIIAKDMRVPIVPIRIDGLRDLLHNGILPIGHLPKIPPVTITFGKQIEISKGSYQEIAKNLRETVINL